ncbi:MAG: glutathione ABC transporter permease GsiC [Anaerolinea sp.]|nr:glutathione ABC transporter permease GsiC [Anaerolinea sp.]
MPQFVLRRLVLSLPTLVIVSFLIFGMVRINPDSIVAARLGEGYTEDQAARIRDQYGLDEPVVTEYARWVGNILRGDWGESAYTFEPVLKEMGPKIAVTLELALFAIVFAVIIGLPVGVFSAMRQDQWPDYVLRTNAILGLSVPGFYVATVVLAILANQFSWIPDIRYHSFLDDPLGNLKQMWLPALILSLGTAASVMRYSRTMMLEVLRQDYIRTAWAKGLSERVVIFRHALKNAMLPVVTILGLTMAALVGGTVIFETLFGLPGLGRHLTGAVQRKDFVVIQGVTLFFAVAVVVINLIVDISYTVLDPRSRPQR